MTSSQGKWTSNIEIDHSFIVSIMDSNYDAKTGDSAMISAYLTPFRVTSCRRVGADVSGGFVVMV